MANGHGGRRPNTGGKRPGAGRKPKATEEYQAKMRDIFQEVVTCERWRRIVSVAASYAEAGNNDARKWLAPWIVGAEPKEVKLTGDENEPLRVLVEYANSNGEIAKTT